MKSKFLVPVLLAVMAVTPMKMAIAAEFSLSVGDVSVAPLDTVAVPIYAYVSEGNMRFVKAIIEWDGKSFALLNFTSNISGGYFDTNYSLPFGACGSDVTDNALAMWSGTGVGTGGLMGWANFVALPDGESSPVKLDCFCGPGVSHLELLTYSTTSPYGLLGYAVNRCDENLTALDGSITIEGALRAVGVQAGTWDTVKQLYR